MDCHVAAAHMTWDLVDLRAGNPEHIDFGHAVLAKFCFASDATRSSSSSWRVPDIYLH